MVTQGTKAGSDHGGKLQKKRLAILTAKTRHDDAGKQQIRCRTCPFLLLAIEQNLHLDKAARQQRRRLR
ncbi:N5-glutamine S-adenosyl-L-methionine-dependent methyltransferase [Pseudomonas mandelii JR-1]|uniref:N5-glutamine S-adenosyl-L-methionine-dependent methyltransferase n=1 Tax=Pseudomonas mandelii JR-1 TaxID=1147786 RepID=A0A024EIJ2_9PSED|nr:N5-glutamine S-adenosyl-L-methionine-dependent methyltransferase [Pseudomonas mandelii JR-1]